MGNFSRNTFDPLKRYTSVRLQQGVPLLDADWNEMDDIRRTELQTLIKWFVGDGIPANSDGSRNDAFRIAALPTPERDNFRILAGGTEILGSNRCLVDGVEVVITQDLDFKSQPLHENYAGPNPPVAADVAPVDPNVPKIAPIPLASGSYQVYLEVWEWEIGAALDRTHLINEALGVETCVRFKRSWAVRVFKAGEAIRLPKHSYYLLATLDRTTDGALITPERINDQRCTGLNLAKYLKIPVYVERGSIVVNNQILTVLFSQLRTALTIRLQTQSLFVNAAPSELDRTLVYFALQDIFQACVTGIVQARTNNINSMDALQILLTLVDAQQTFLTALEQHGNPSESNKNSFIAEYRRRLDLLTSEVNTNSLINAYLIQRSITDWLSVGFEAARFLSENWESLLRTGLRRLQQRRPDLFQPGGLLSSQRAIAEFLRSFSQFFRGSIIESCQQNSAQPLDAVLPFVTEFLRSLGIPAGAYIEMLQGIKDDVGASTVISNDAKLLAGAFLDYAMAALS